MIGKFAIWVGVVTVAGAVNYAVYRSHISDSPHWRETEQSETPKESPDGFTDLPWPLLERTKVDITTHQVTYQENLRALEGKRVRLNGVLCVLQNLVTDGKVTSCMILAPSKLNCCGMTCDARPEVMVFADCSKHQFEPPTKKSMVTVTGTLQLQKDDSSWSLYTIEDAEIVLPK